ncbi:MAG: NifU family protein [Fibrobacteria bacterium]|nr:NifU family protein [Fibrobacteria bacterium]
MKVQRTDPTPNPDALKFVLDGQLVTAGSRSFRDRLLCEDPVAKSLFEIEEVVSIFFVSNVATVTKDPFADWSMVAPRIVQALEAHEAPVGAAPARVSAPSSPVLQEGDFQTDTGFFERSYEEKMAFVNSIFDEAVRPGLASDGGGLLLVEIVEKTVRIEYQGACGSCPSSTSGTLFFIENILRSRVHPELIVELI